MIISDRVYKILSTSDVFGYFILHAAILFENDGREYVLHLTFDGVEVIPIEVFESKRRILWMEEYQLKRDVNTDDIIRMMYNDRFEAINNNCENFVNDFINTYTTCHCIRFSQQVALWLSIATVIIALIYKYKKQ